MNGVHDMGGMQDMGPIEHEKNEPVFHARWEARAYALNRAMGAWGKWNIDASRHARELLRPADYLRMSYYESWVARLIELMVKHGFVTHIRKGSPASRNVTAAARFKAGQKVRARNVHPTGHTRLPRYARGKMGTIVRDHGVFVFPDTNAHFLGEKPQHLYSVRFGARELWGAEARPRDAVYLDMWEDYLEGV